MKMFTLMPGEMQRSDPPEGGDEPFLEITPQEIAIIQAMAKEEQLNDEKVLFLQRMQELCPFTLPSNTMH